MTAPSIEDAFPTRRTLQVGPVETHVAEAGDGPPVLLLHGNPDTHAVWSAVVRSLARTHRCIAPDLPGWGRSRAPRDIDDSLDAQARWVAELVEGLALDRVHLVVHDVGGTYGLAFATTRPERVQTLTIFNTNFFPDYRWHFWGRVWRTRVLGGLAMAVANRPLFVRETRRGGPKVPREYAEHAYGSFGRDVRRRVLRYYRALDSSVYAGWDTRLLEATATTPKQVLWGDRDPFIPSTTADRYGAPARHFADCGHWVMIEAPDEAAAAIAELISRPAKRAG